MGAVAGSAARQARRSGARGPGCRTEAEVPPALPRGACGRAMKWACRALGTFQWGLVSSWCASYTTPSALTGNGPKANSEIRKGIAAVLLASPHRRSTTSLPCARCVTERCPSGQQPCIGMPWSGTTTPGFEPNPAADLDQLERWRDGGRRLPLGERRLRRDHLAGHDPNAGRLPAPPVPAARPLCCSSKPSTTSSGEARRPPGDHLRSRGNGRAA